MREGERGKQLAEELEQLRSANREGEGDDEEEEMATD